MVEVFGVVSSVVTVVGVLVVVMVDAISGKEKLRHHKMHAVQQNFKLLNVVMRI